MMFFRKGMGFVCGCMVSVGVFASGCAPVIVGGVATAGYMAVQERGMKTAVMDTKIKTHIKDRLGSKDYHYLTDVGVHVLEGDVLLTGVVTTPEAARGIVADVQGLPDVKRVFNELFIAAQYAPEQYAQDSWISTKLRTRLLGAQDVYSVNYLVSVVKGHVYILGLAASESERERVIHLARTTSGVQKVHNYIRLGDGSRVEMETQKPDMLD